MARMRYGWAKIRGAYRLSRRNIARIVAAISAAMLWFHTATAAPSVGMEKSTLRSAPVAAIVRVLHLLNAHRYALKCCEGLPL